MTGNGSDWVMRGMAASTIIFNDPVWSEQEYAMQRSERRRGTFDPPVPTSHVDALHARWERASALQDRMVAEGCDALPVEADTRSWAAVAGDMLLAGRTADRRGIRWVPAALLAECQALVATPLPGSVDLTA